MLPFRPMSQVAPKVVWGSTGDHRHAQDCLLTCIGLAYGQMGTNPELHQWLETFYNAVLAETADAPASAWTDAYDRFDFRKVRAYDITKEDLLRGFPSLESVQIRNSKDAAYHTVNRNPEEALFYDFEWEYPV